MNNQQKLETRDDYSAILLKASPCRVFHFCIHKFQKNIYFCYIDYAKVFDCVDHNKLWKIL